MRMPAGEGGRGAEPRPARRWNAGAGHLKNIIPLPMNMPRLQNPVVRVMQGYIVIMMDLETTLSSLDFSKLFEGQRFKLFG